MESLGISLKQNDGRDEDREVWRLITELVPPQSATHMEKRAMTKEDKKNCIYNIHNLALLKRYCSKSVLLKK